MQYAGMCLNPAYCLLAQPFLPQRILLVDEVLEVASKFISVEFEGVLADFVGIEGHGFEALDGFRKAPNGLFFEEGSGDAFNDGL